MNENNKSASLSDILCGLQQAVSNAVATLRAQQVNMLDTYIQDDGKPLTKTIVFGDKTVEVPLMSLLSQSNIEMDDVEINFKAKISDVTSMAENGFFRTGKMAAVIPQSTLMLNMNGIRSENDDTIQIKVHFKTTDIPEGVARLNDEYNKMI